MLGLVSSLPAQSAAPRVALVLDQDAPCLEPQVAAFKREIQGFFRPGEITLLPPRAGDGTAAGVSRALDRALSDSSVAAVVALGPIGSHQLAHAGEPRKPAIAATIVDASWQGIPKKDGASGVHNLAYVDESYALSGTVADFHRMIPFRRMAVLLDPELLGGDPRARGQRPLSRQLRRRRGRGRPGAGHGRSDPGRAAGRRRRRVPHARIPALGEAQTARLIAGLERAAAAHAEPYRRRRARGRAAPPTSRPSTGCAAPAGWRWTSSAILASKDAGTLPVQLHRRAAAHPQPRHRPDDRVLARLQRDLTDAELVGTDSLGPADTVSLAEAMRGAVAANLDLKAANLEVESARRTCDSPAPTCFRASRAGSADTVTRRRPRPRPAWASSPSGSSTAGSPSRCRSTPSRLGPATARSSICSRAAKLRREQTRLDVVLDAAQAYISVLQARTLAEVRRSNLYRNRSNLETAHASRESIGSTSRADLYRWQGEVANARRDLIAAVEHQVQVGDPRARAGSSICRSTGRWPSAR